MTATIKPPDRGSDSRRRPLRFSSLEILGFTDAESVWSDPPIDADTEEIEPSRGRHEVVAPQPDPFADWKPAEFGGRLAGSNVRWGMVVVLILSIVSLGGLALWLYQRPAVQEQTAIGEVSTQAGSLRSVLPLLEEFNQTLLEDTSEMGPSSLVEVESEARALFDASGTLSGSGTGARTAATQAASAALDGVRLASEARSYRAAVTPVLIAPELETDPELIQLDEAARSFGSWQLAFDEVRTALPEGFLPDVSQRLDVLSGDLAGIMGRYVDALREDDRSAAEDVLSSLSSRLSQVRSSLDESLERIQGRVTARIVETGDALDRLLES